MHVTLPAYAVLYLRRYYPEYEEAARQRSVQGFLLGMTLVLFSLIASACHYMPPPPLPHRVLSSLVTRYTPTIDLHQLSLASAEATNASNCWTLRKRGHSNPKRNQLCIIKTPHLLSAVCTEAHSVTLSIGTLIMLPQLAIYKHNVIWLRLIW